MIVINPHELAHLLGVSRDRMTIDVKNTPFGEKTLVAVEIFIDGKDLTPEQLAIFKPWLEKLIGPTQIGSKS